MLTINENTKIRGFTLIEVITVLLLLSILSVIIVPRMFNTGADDIVTIDKMKTHLRYAQLRSMNSQVIWGINFNDASKTYWLFNNDPGPPNDVTVRLTLPSEASNFITYDNAIIVSPSLITFDSLGRPFTDVAAQTAFAPDPPHLDLGNGKTITITPNTGYIP